MVVVRVDGDHGGDEAGHADRLQVALAQVLVQLVQVVHGEEDAQHVDEDPEHVEHVVAEGALDQRARRLVQVGLRVGGQRARQERRAQVDRYTRKPIF